MSDAPYSDWTKQQMTDELDARSISFPSGATKDQLLALLNADDAEDGDMVPVPDAKVAELVDLVLSKVTITDARLVRIFETSELTDEQREAANRVRRAAGGFAQVIINETRNGPDRQAAITLARQAAMLAVQSIAVGA